MSEARPEDKLFWRQLSQRTRAGLENKLENLYGEREAEAAFDALAVDKQQSLLIFERRLRELDLWDDVRRVENVYGVGGVGMNFIARPSLLSTLRRRHDFTHRFAAHRASAGGFLERRRKSASLHFLHAPDAQRRWAIHFDLYSPLALSLNAWRHLLHEKLRGATPDWRAIKVALWSEDEAMSDER